MAFVVSQVSSAAPVAAALASGTASEATLSRLYGGSAAEGVSELSMAIPVYEAIGRVCALTHILLQHGHCAIAPMLLNISVLLSESSRPRQLMS